MVGRGSGLSALTSGPDPTAIPGDSGGRFGGSEPTPSGLGSAQTRKSVAAAICRHCDEHLPVSFHWTLTTVSSYRGANCSSHRPSHLPKLLTDLGIFCRSELPSVFKGLVSLKTALSILVRVEVVQEGGR